MLCLQDNIKSQTTQEIASIYPVIKPIDATSCSFWEATSAFAKFQTTTVAYSPWLFPFYGQADPPPLEFCTDLPDDRTRSIDQESP